MGRPLNDKFFTHGDSGEGPFNPGSKDGLQINLTVASYTEGPTNDTDSYIVRQRSPERYEITNGSETEVLRMANSGSVPAGRCALEVLPFDRLSTGEAMALTWDTSRSEFLWAQNYFTPQNLFSVTSSGVSTFIGTMDHVAKGLAFLDTTLYSVSKNDDLLRTIDSLTGSTLSSITITLAAETVDGATGLASKAGTLWALLKLNGQSGRELVTVNKTTGVATSIGNTGDKFAGLAFDAGGATLYAVSGDGGGSPSETLFTLSQTTAAPSSVLTLGAGDDGETIAFNPDDGLIYHASGLGDVIFERINAGFTATTDINPGGIEYVRTLTSHQVKTWDENVFVWSQLQDGGVANEVGEADFNPTMN